MATPPVAVPVPAFDKPRHCPVTATVGPVLLIEGLHGPRTEETMRAFKLLISACLLLSVIGCAYYGPGPGYRYHHDYYGRHWDGYR